MTLPFECINDDLDCSADRWLRVDDVVGFEYAERQLALPPAGGSLNPVVNFLFLGISPGHLDHQGIVKPWTLRQDRLEHELEIRSCSGQRPDYGWYRILSVHRIRHSLVR